MNAPSLDQHGIPACYRFRPEWEITPRRVRDLLAQTPRAIRLIDCRRPDEYAVARIEGAELIPLDDLHHHVERLKDEADDNPAIPIVIHCHTGRRSLRAAVLLRDRGITNAASMAGGIDLWSIDIDPAIPRY